jgi:hypothetical protein
VVFAAIAKLPFAPGSGKSRLQLPFKGPVQDGGEQGVHFGGGLSLELFQGVHLGLEAIQVGYDTALFVDGWKWNLNHSYVGKV